MPMPASRRKLIRFFANKMLATSLKHVLPYLCWRRMERVAMVNQRFRQLVKYEYVRRFAKNPMKAVNEFTRHTYDKYQEWEFSYCMICDQCNYVTDECSDSIQVVRKCCGIYFRETCPICNIEDRSNDLFMCCYCAKFHVENGKMSQTTYDARF